MVALIRSWQVDVVVVEAAAIGAATTVIPPIKLGLTTPNQGLQAPSTSLESRNIQLLTILSVQKRISIFPPLAANRTRKGALVRLFNLD